MGLRVLDTCRDQKSSRKKVEPVSKVATLNRKVTAIRFQLSNRSMLSARLVGVVGALAVAADAGRPQRLAAIVANENSAVGRAL